MTCCAGAVPRWYRGDMTIENSDGHNITRSDADLHEIGVKGMTLPILEGLCGLVQAAVYEGWPHKDGERAALAWLQNLACEHGFEVRDP